MNKGRKCLIFIASLAVSITAAFSQIVFEEGYLIDESDQKINCLIKNVGWKNNPNEFQYKLLSNDTIRIAKLESVKEFAFNGGAKYIRVSVKIDRSSDQLGSLNNQINSNFEEEQQFLEVLIEGRASLFSYTDVGLKRFFYNLNNSEIRQLVYKKYRIDDRIAYNKSYQQQLYNNLNCNSLDKKYFERIDYRKKELEEVFIKFNECENVGYIKHGAEQKKDLFDLSLRLGFNSNKLKIRNSLSDFYNTDFGTYSSFQFGIETELILPYNKNKWSIVLSPTYNTIHKQTKRTPSDNVSGGFLNATIRYKSIELPIGLRHSFYLNKASKLFINASYNINWAYNSNIVFTRHDGSYLDSLDIKSTPNFAIGIGYQYQNKYGLELNYQANHDILREYGTWGSYYNTLSIALSLSIF